jgi:RNA pseudouridylate synthase
MTEEELAARLLYRDALMLVIDKPAGIAVHRGPKGGESLEDYFHALRFGLPRNPALVHRLDRDTSGCLVLGRHHKALEKLGLLFKQGKVQKTYWAIVEGSPEQREGLIDLPLKRLDPSVRTSLANVLASDRTRGRPFSSRARAADRAHASAACSLRGAGLANPGRCRLWPWRATGAAAPCQGDYDPALQKQGRHKDRSAAPGPYAGGARLTAIAVQSLSGETQGRAARRVWRSSSRPLASAHEKMTRQAAD